MKSSQEKRETLALWAAACAERVLKYFEANSNDAGPRNAIVTIREWADGKSSIEEVRASALEAKKAALMGQTPAGRAAALAASHAAATLDVISHARHSANYAIRSVKAIRGRAAANRETEWQYKQLPEEFRNTVFPPVKS